MNIFKTKIYVDFNRLIKNYDRRKWTTKLSGPKKGADNFLKKLSENYKIYIFTTRNRENTYKWLIRYYLDEYIQDVTNKKINKNKFKKPTL
jgi:hypothetical protein